jgi:itaconate CoA-transferase
LAGPLTGLRVVALEQAVAAPLCTRHLADLGADVIKVERPGGDFARHYDTIVAGQSAYFVWLNRGKRSIELDLTNGSDRAVMDRLLERADVFVHNLGPGAVDRLGYGWTELHERSRKLICCEISGFGSDGPYRDRKAFDLLLQGESGLTSITGDLDRPAKVGISIADICSGMYALTGVMAAVINRSLSGAGTRIEVSMLECLAEWMSVPGLYRMHRGQEPPRSGLYHSMIAPYGPYVARDGRLVNIAVHNGGQWSRLCQVLELTDLESDERFATNELRVRNRIALDQLIDERLDSIDGGELCRRLQLADVPYGDLNDVLGLINHPQLQARGHWIDVAVPGGSTKAISHPFNLAGIVQSESKVPALDEDGDRIRSELGLARKVPR